MSAAAEDIGLHVITAEWASLQHDDDDDGPRAISAWDAEIRGRNKWSGSSSSGLKSDSVKTDR